VASADNAASLSPTAQSLSDIQAIIDQLAAAQEPSALAA